MTETGVRQNRTEQELREAVEAVEQALPEFKDVSFSVFCERLRYEKTSSDKVTVLMIEDENADRSRAKAKIISRVLESEAGIRLVSTCEGYGQIDFEVVSNE